MASGELGSDYLSNGYMSSGKYSHHPAGGRFAYKHLRWTIRELCLRTDISGLNGAFPEGYPDINFGQCFFDHTISYQPYIEDIALYSTVSNQANVNGLNNGSALQNGMSNYGYSTDFSQSQPAHNMGLSISSLITAVESNYPQSHPPVGLSIDHRTSSSSSTQSTGNQSSMSSVGDVEMDNVRPPLWSLRNSSKSFKTSSSNSPIVGSPSISSTDSPISLKSSEGKRSTSRTSKLLGRKVSKQEAQQIKKQAHSNVEKRYRANLNTKILTLHENLVKASEEDAASSPLTPILSEAKARGSALSISDTTKTKKADVLTDALHFVHRTQKEKKMMKDEIETLKRRIQSLEKMVKCQHCPIHKQANGVDVEKRMFT